MGNIGILSKISGLAGAVTAINNIIDAINRLTPIESPTVKPSFTSSGVSYRAIVPNVSPAIDKSIPTMFGIKSIQGNIVIINGGKIWVGKTEKAVDQAYITINTDSYVGYEYSYSSGGLSIVNFGSTFATDDGFIRKPLYHFKYTENTVNGVINKSVSLDNDCTLCDCYPANFG